MQKQSSIDIDHDSLEGLAAIRQSSQGMVGEQFSAADLYWAYFLIY